MNKKRIARIVSSRTGQSPRLIETDIKCVGKGTYNHIYVYRDSAFKIDNGAPEMFALKNKKSPAYIDQNVLRESVVHLGISEHPNIVRTIDFHIDQDGIIFELEKMDSDLKSSRYMKESKNMNADVFEILLRSLLSGIEHMHSYGMTHGDIKPPNILVRVRNRDRPEFKLCDFNLMQLTPYDMIDKHLELFGTPNYIPTKGTEYRSILTDIFMIGTTMVDTILSIGNIVDINLSTILSNKDRIIGRVGMRNYQILCLMCQRLPSRPYIDHILQYLDDRSSMPFQIYETQGRDLTLDDENLMPKDQQYDVFVLSNHIANGYCTPRQLYDQGLNYYQTRLRDRLEKIYPVIEADFTPIPLDHHKLNSFRNLIGTSQYNYVIVAILDCVYNQILKMGIHESPALYIAQAMILFPSELEPDEWIEKYNQLPVETFNSNVLRFIQMLKNDSICLAPPIDMFRNEIETLKNDNYDDEIIESSDSNESGSDSGSESNNETDNESSFISRFGEALHNMLWGNRIRNSGSYRQISNSCSVSTSTSILSTSRSSDHSSYGGRSRSRSKSRSRSRSGWKRKVKRKRLFTRDSKNIGFRKPDSKRTKR